MVYHRRPDDLLFPKMGSKCTPLEPTLWRVRPYLANMIEDVDKSREMSPFAKLLWLPLFYIITLWLHANVTRKPSYRWLTRATRKPAKNCSNSTCLQRCRWQYWPIFIRWAVVASEICEIPRNSLKIQAYKVQGHPRSSILVSIESPCTTSY